MAAMTLAVGVAYREIYSWKAAVLCRKTMASRLPRHTFNLYFQSSVEKTGFLDRLRKVRERLTPLGKPLLSHHEFMLAMFDVVEMHTPEPATDSSTPSSTMLRNGGMAYTSLVKNDQCP